MIELQLVGYTADLEYLVFCEAAEGASRFKASVDEDLLATLAEVVERTDPRRLPAFMAPVAAPPPPPPPPPPPAPAPPPPPAPQGPGRRPGVGPLAAVAVLLGTTGAPSPTSDGEGPAPVGLVDPAPSRGSRLSPREIQALLRMGRTPAAVAKQAGVEESWVQRWLPPIEAERERTIAAARSARIDKARKGPSADPVGDAVDRHLAAKKADDVEWSATRRDGDPYWVVAVRYRSRGKMRRARWRFDPDTREIEPEDVASGDLAWTPRPGTRDVASRKTSSPAKRGGAKKKATARKAATKSAAKAGTRAAKKTSSKSGAAKKGTAKRATTKKRPAQPPPEPAAPQRPAAEQPPADSGGGSQTTAPS